MITLIAPRLALASSGAGAAGGSVTRAIGVGVWRLIVGGMLAGVVLAGALLAGPLLAGGFALAGALLDGGFTLAGPSLDGGAPFLSSSP